MPRGWKEASGARLKIEIMKSGKTSMTEGAAGLYPGAGAPLSRSFVARKRLAVHRQNFEWSLRTFKLSERPARGKFCSEDPRGARAGPSAFMRSERLA